jgi:site-specific DNA-methyltransferase (adenine-specific)
MKMTKTTEVGCQILFGDCREVLKGFHHCFDLIVTSPPYADARKQHYQSIEPEEYSEWFATFHPVFWQVLKPTGSLVINIKDKVVKGTRSHYVWKTIDQFECLGWSCIDDYIWAKSNSMPGRWPTRLRDSWEYIFHLSPSKKPYFNADAVRVPIKDWIKKESRLLNKQRIESKTGSGFGRRFANWAGKSTALPSNVIILPTSGNTGHPAAFPVDLPEFFIKLLVPEQGWVLDPFAGSGTTGIAAAHCGRRSVLVDNVSHYCQLAYQRLQRFNHDTR